MSEKILVPALGESVTEATVSKWLKNQGESVISDEPLVELETDKVNIEVPAPSNGILETISVKEGETVNVGALLGTINENSNLTKSETKEDSKYTPPLKKIEPKKKEVKQENVAPIVLDQDQKIEEEAPLILDQDQKIEEEAPLILDQVLESKNEIKK